MTSVLIVGGSGYVGTPLVYALLRRGDNVQVLDLKKPRADVKWIKIDITNFKSTRKAIERSSADYIVHLAAMQAGDPENMMRINVLGTTSVLEAARQAEIKRVVVASSASALGFHGSRPDIKPLYLPVDEKHPTRPADVYSASKLLQENLCEYYQRGWGLEMVRLRLTTVISLNSALEWGRQRWDGFADQLREGKRVEVPFKYPSGEIYHFVDARDIAHACILAAEKKEASGEAFNIAGPEKVSSEQFIHLVKEFAPRAEIEYSNWGLAGGGVIYFDLTKAKAMLGYNPKYGLRESLKMLYEQK
jgi:UDP-glucose 4-epimerase